MTLDISTIADQIVEMVEELDPQHEAERFSELRRTWETLDSAEVNNRFATAKTSFLLPGSHHHFRDRSPLPAPVDSYTVVGTDGSFILPDRHTPARFYLINTGTVVLRYGEQPEAELTAEPHLYFREEELVVPDSTQRIPIGNTVVGPRRAVEELQVASQKLAGEPNPAVALQDGTLILWSLEPLHESIVNWLLPQFLDALRSLRDRGQPVAGYISAPGSNELMNTMRVAYCDYPAKGWPVDCDHCRSTRKPKCDELPIVTDRFLVGEVAELQPGERTAVYESTSKILQQYTAGGDADLGICFFYLNVGQEVGRVEIPRWVADDPAQLDLVHWVIYDQCQRGLGYPTVLQEAHEKAVVTMADRQALEATLERALAQAGIIWTRTGKDGSKRGRFV